MSRKFLDDNLEIKLTSKTDGTVALGTLPKNTTSPVYERGHLALDTGSGLRFTNEGTTTLSLFLNERYNALVLHEPLADLPHIVANQSASQNTAVNVVGTNSADAGATFDTTGGVTLTTTTASGDQSIIQANTNSAWGNVSLIADNGLIFETQIVTGASIASETVWAGLKLTNTSVTATDNDQAFFRYQNGVNSGKFQVIDSTGGTDNANDSGVTVAASTAYLLQIRIDSARKPHYFINGKRVFIGNALTAATALKPFVGVQTGTTAAKNITVRHLRLTLPRSPINT